MTLQQHTREFPVANPDHSRRIFETTDDALTALREVQSTMTPQGVKDREKFNEVMNGLQEYLARWGAVHEDPKNHAKKYIKVRDAKDGVIH